MKNTVCRNYNRKEKAGSILGIISLNCGKCEFNDNCDIKTAYDKAKDYAASMEFVEVKGETNAKLD